MSKEYAVYKGDELLVVGTKEECAEALKVTPDYIQWLTTPTAKRRLASRKNPDKCTTAFVLKNEEQACRICGCTWLMGCPVGCYWVEEDLCSECVS